MSHELIISRNLGQCQHSIPLLTLPTKVSQPFFYSLSSHVAHIRRPLFLDREAKNNFFKLFFFVKFVCLKKWFLYTHLVTLHLFFHASVKTEYNSNILLVIFLCLYAPSLLFFFNKIKIKNSKPTYLHYM